MYTREQNSILAFHEFLLRFSRQFSRRFSRRFSRGNTWKTVKELARFVFLVRAFAVFAFGAAVTPVIAAASEIQTAAKTHEWLTPRLPRNQNFEKQLTLFTQKGNQILSSRKVEPVQLVFKGGNFSLAPVLLAKKKAGHSPALALLDHRETVTLGNAAEKTTPFLSSQLVLVVKSFDLPALEKAKSWSAWIGSQKLGIPLLSDRALFLLANLVDAPLYRRLPGGIQANRENSEDLRALQVAVNAKNLFLNMDRETLISRWINEEFTAIWCFSDDLNELRARTPFEWSVAKNGILTPAKKKIPTLWQIDLVLLQNSTSALIWLEQGPTWLRSPEMLAGFASAGYSPPPNPAQAKEIETRLPADAEWIQIQTAWIKALGKLFSPNQSPEVTQFFTSIDQELGNLKP